MLQEPIGSRVLVDANGCWLWTGPLTDDGYARRSFDDKMQYVHRLTYRLFVGPINVDQQIDHLCRVRHCVNPNHLEVVTAKVNMERGSRAAQTHCKRGHPLSGDNLLPSNAKKGSRGCRECGRIRAKEYKLRQKKKR